jgi:ADP-dependent NAD(P)H-hydrate dehydratase / NAD(P)H-hydrate epimerase
MKVVTAEEMREIDRKTIEEFGISGRVLMERAGTAVAAKIREIYGRKKIIVLSGGGNNGGDGMLAAGILNNEGWDVTVFLASKPGRLKGDTLSQYEAVLRAGVSVKQAETLLEHKTDFLRPNTIIIDALFGTGLGKDITGSCSDLIGVLNRSKLSIIAVDIPSGISSDTGQVMGNAIKADCTVTFGLPKRGHLLYPGAEYTGRLFVENIGFPAELLKSDNLTVELPERDNVLSLIPERKKYSYKGNYGHVLLVAGSRGKTGAAIMAAKACLRAGAGLVTIGVPESLAGIFQTRVTEEMTLLLPDKGDGTLSKKALDGIFGYLEKTAGLIAIGPGIGVSNDTEKIIERLILHSNSPIIIDADGLNSLKGNTKIFRKAKTPVILTPHPGEMAQLMRRQSKKEQCKTINSGLRTEIEKDRINTAVSFVKETGTFLVLKGVPTIIASPDGRAFINSTGNPGMSTAGTGDVLTGMIAGFLGQGLKPLNASILGVYMHGLAGDIAAYEKGEHSLIASDIIDSISAAFKMMKGLNLNYTKINKSSPKSA